MKLRAGLVFGAAAIALMTGDASAAKIRVLHAFDGDDGSLPLAAVVPGAHGKVYGTTTYGGNSGCNGQTCGTVFSLSRDGTFATVHFFQPGGDGFWPQTLVVDGAGNLFGVTEEGGSGTGCTNGPWGCGTVFKIARNGTESIVYSFQGGHDGAYPSGLALDASGNLYVPTQKGGGGLHREGRGVVAKIAPDATETILYRFSGGSDGFGPYGNPLIDSDGNLYASESGVQEPGAFGVITGEAVFKLTPGGTKSIVHFFFGAPNDGSDTVSSLTADSNGNLFGVTAGGGAHNFGTVFKIDAGGSESLLYSFGGGADGATPDAGVVLDGSGNLFGTTMAGGDSACANGCGTVFMLTQDGNKTTLGSLLEHQGSAAGGLFMNKHGTLIGVAAQGGANGQGTVFRIGGF